MSETRFTPGEWKFGVRPDGSMWLSLGDPKKGPHYQGDLVASIDDARLIVNARELYEWLSIIAGVIRESDGIAGFHLNGELMKWSDLDPEGQIEAALSKARGEA